MRSRRHTSGCDITATPAPYLVEEILEEILIRLPTPAALARASTACASFRRIITARSFLRRYRKLHPPPLLGFVAENGGFDPVQEPHPSAPLGHAIAADFSYSFVPKPDEAVFTPWSPCEVRDGRVLLECDRWFCRTTLTIFRKFLAVCHPLSWKSVLLPPLPVDVDMTMVKEHLLGYEPILAPIGDEEDETSFRVLCWANYESKFFMFLFSSATGKWCIAASASWSSFGTVETSENFRFSFNYCHDRLYWMAPDGWGDKLFVLDTCSMEFSTVNILTSCHMQLINLPDPSRWPSSVVVATEGGLEMFTLIRNCSLNDSYSIYHTTQRNDDHSSGKCELKNVIVLPRPYRYFIVGVTGGFMFLRGFRETQQQGSRALIEDLFALAINTSELKMVHGGAQKLHNSAKRVQPYFGFLPSLSKPSL